MMNELVLLFKRLSASIRWNREFQSATRGCPAVRLPTQQMDLSALEKNKKLIQNQDDRVASQTSRYADQEFH